MWLPITEKIGIPPHDLLHFKVIAADNPKMTVTYRDYPTIEADPETPPILIICPLCEGEEDYPWMQATTLSGYRMDEIYCWKHGRRKIQLKASRFCLQALARMTYDVLGRDYDYQIYKTKIEREEWALNKSIEILEKWNESLENQPPVPKIKVHMSFGSDGFIRYIVGREDELGEKASRLGADNTDQAAS